MAARSRFDGTYLHSRRYVWMWRIHVGEIRGLGILQPYVPRIATQPATTPFGGLSVGDSRTVFSWEGSVYVAVIPLGPN